MCPDVSTNSAIKEGTPTEIGIAEENVRTQVLGLMMSEIRRELKSRLDFIGLRRPIALVTCNPLALIQKHVYHD